ncbi:MAG TPA: hypothetical protein VGG48_07035 [Rhizomicrobium sp.]
MRGMPLLLLWTAIFAGVAAWIAWPFVAVGLQAPDDFALVSVGGNRVEVASGPTYADLLRIDLSSHVDIQKLVSEHRLYLHTIVSPCRDGTVDPAHKLWIDMVPGDGLYDASGAVAPPDGPPDPDATSGPRDSEHRFGYYLFISPQFRDPRLRGQYLYDLGSQPADLCLIVEGRGTALGGGWHVRFFRSNVVVVPSQIVADAIARYQLQQ